MTKTKSRETVNEAIQKLAEAMMGGHLDVRCDPSGHTDEDAELMLVVNRMLDTLIAPMKLAANALEEIAHGRIPPFVIDEYKGEYNHIKQNINTLLAILYGMHKETKNLTDSVSEGNLKTRGNDWDYEGIWKELISGVNGTLDAIVTPINEASTVLGRLSRYDLSARMRGKYYGDHAVMRKSMNTTAEALHGAVSQVAETVELVSSAGQRITQGSETVLKGAVEQSRQLSETSGSLEILSESSAKSATKTNDAQQNARKAASSIINAKNAMDRMLEAMKNIRDAADSTAGIVNEIDAISKETGGLSANALKKAANMRTSAGGFGVVAQEIRKLSRQCAETVGKMRQLEKEMFDPKANGDREKLQQEFEYLVEDLDDVATSSNLLGVNAAIEAAHVEGAGFDFKALTDEINLLAIRSADAAKRTDQLIRTSVSLARNGENLSREIEGHLAGAVEGADSISALTDEISLASREQASSLEQINQSVARINLVTQNNSDSAQESAGAAKDLERQMKKLTSMVHKFKLEASC